MISIAEDTATSPAPAPEGKPKRAKKAKRAPQGAKVALKKGKSAKKDHPSQESAQRREESQIRPRGQQDQQGPGAAEAAGRRHSQGAHENDRLAGAFRTRLPVGYCRQEDGPYGNIHQGRGRGAQVLRQSLDPV